MVLRSPSTLALVFSLLFWPLAGLADAASPPANTSLNELAIKKTELEIEWTAKQQFQYVNRFARKTLGMNEEQAKAFAVQALSVSPTHEMLYRYLEAYAFASAPVDQGGLGFPPYVADAFAQQQEYYSSEELYLYKTVYHEALADQLTNPQGGTFHLNPYQARQVAEILVREPQGAAYSRVHYALNSLPLENDNDFDFAVHMGNVLSQASPENFEKFQASVDHQSHKMPVAQAFATAQAQVPIPFQTFYSQTDYNHSSTLPANVTVSPADQQAAQAEENALDAGTTTCPPAQVNPSIKGGAVAPSMSTVLNATADATYSNDPSLNLDFYNAATAFGLPEKFLACTMKIESHGHPTVCSYKANGEALAAGAMEITQPTYDWIVQASQATSGPNQKLGDGFRAYEWLQNSKGNTVHLPSTSWPESCFDTNFSVGAGALLFRQYASDLFGPNTDPRTLTVDQLSMLAASYNAGPGGLRSYCQNLNDVQGCLSSLKYSKPPNLETHNYIIMMSSCLQHPGPELPE